MAPSKSSMLQYLTSTCCTYRHREHQHVQRARRVDLSRSRHMARARCCYFVYRLCFLLLQVLQVLQVGNNRDVYFNILLMADP
jgi:hypothetical protein